MSLPIEIIAASAGSGKTYHLAKILREALAAGEVEPENVVAVTFTTKAAAELEERARRFLIEKGRSEDAHRLSAARIGTVHGVCARLVGDFAFELGLSPELEVLDEPASKAALRAAFSRVLTTERENRLADLESRLRYWEWQELRDQVLRWARDNGIDAEGLRASRDRSLESFRELLDEPFSDGEAFERRVAAALRRFIDGVPAEDETKKTRGAVELAKRCLYFLERRVPLSWDDWARLAGLEAAVKSRELTDDARREAATYARHPRLRDDLEQAIRLVFDISADALEAYESYKRERAVVDFPDQLALALALLRRDDVRDRLSAEIDLVLVDEFQDSSPIQLAVFIELARLARRNVWVGDQKQAIYGFLGADPVLMDATIEAILGDGDPETLRKSWRSRPELVGLTSDLFAPAFERLGIPPERTRLVPAEDAEPEGLGSVLERWRLDTKNQAADALALAGGVRDLLDDPEQQVRDDRSPLGRRDVRPSDVAVLCRTNRRCQQLASALQALGVPSALSKADLLATPEARLVLAGMARWADPRDSLAAAEIARLAVYPADGDAWLRDALADPPGEIFAACEPVQRLDSARRSFAAASVLEAHDRLTEAIDARHIVSGWGDQPQRLANLDALRALVETYSRDGATEGASTSPAGFLGWAERQREAGGDSQAALASHDAVTVSTWHGAKGLEWPITILFDLEPWTSDWALGVRVEARETFSFEDPLADRWIRYWPNPYVPNRSRTFLHERVAQHEVTARMEAARAREELRLVYVAWTRARDRVVLVTRKDKTLPKALPVLEGPNGPLLSEPRGETAEWVDRKVALTLRELSRAPPPEPRPSDGEVYVATGPREYPPATLVPSSIDTVGVAAEPEPLGHRILVRGTPDWTIVGDVFHAYFAAARAELDSGAQRRMAQELLERWGLANEIAADDMVEASDRLTRWAGARWPEGVWRREWPLIHRIENGSIVRGTADLVIESDKSFVLVDHKTFPGGRERAREEAASYAGQLSAYARAMEAATGKHLEAAFIHLPVSALVIPVEVV